LLLGVGIVADIVAWPIIAWAIIADRRWNKKYVIRVELSLQFNQ
jgi:hypothetical protein